jgi:hypothetical protein
MAIAFAILAFVSVGLGIVRWNLSPARNPDLDAGSRREYSHRDEGGAEHARISTFRDGTDDVQVREGGRL